MVRRNAPTNIRGEISNTMLREDKFFFKKEITTSTNSGYTPLNRRIAAKRDAQLRVTI